MNNREVIAELSTRLEGLYIRSEVNEVVEALCELIAKTLNRGESINLTSIGKFVVKQSPPRKYYNVHTKQREYSPAKRMVIFTPSKNLLSKLQNQ
ncbi:MAG: HU family DNA-binding protein [Rikenellaceae bacterium]